jgi:hypothetical protein
LMALPVQPLGMGVFKTVRVHIDSHVEFEGHRYSVPNALVGLALELRVTAHAVEALHRGNRVASHMRCAHKGGFTTVTEHLPERHQHHAQWTPERLIAWGERIGVACAATVQKMLEHQPHPEHAYRACLGLLSLSKSYSPARPGWRRPAPWRWAWVPANTPTSATSCSTGVTCCKRAPPLSGHPPPMPMCGVRTTTNEIHATHETPYREFQNDDEHHLEPTAQFAPGNHGPSAGAATSAKRYQCHEL